VNCMCRKSWECNGGVSFVIHQEVQYREKSIDILGRTSWGKVGVCWNQQRSNQSPKMVKPNDTNLQEEGGQGAMYSCGGKRTEVQPPQLLNVTKKISGRRLNGQGAEEWV